ncbi:E3 ubiquitin/ISG15 ligase TRIM25-like [Chanos chanos]|uniref:E3 ubiquitin/ISG15 ligase TRIM25-like n=1 Tax=Chanos chanos TaxID=29144 RepID=A0A6J2US83_CHACN|nr:E3 ubiquitin/ISG15 ligase TRIM25-like [Chanos chanos]
MAEANVSLDHAGFCCPVCLDLLQDPVTIPCGHSYCMSCIRDFWDKNGGKGGYTCPQCRHKFPQRPELNRSTVLADVVARLKRTGVQDLPSSQSSVGHGLIECDFCTGRKLRAVKSCLVCLAAYCEIHIEPHYSSPAFKKHKLIQACASLQDKICPKHDRLLEFYCVDEKTCVCYMCMMQEHSNHETVSAETQRNEKQRELRCSQMEFQRGVQEKEREVRKLRKLMSSLRSSAQAAVKDSEEVFTELICSTERRRSEVTELIRDQEKKELSQAEALVERLEREITGLRERDGELERLFQTDHIDFLKNYSALTSVPGLGSSPRFQVLCREGLSGRCYWEVAWNEEGICTIGLSYKDIRRKGMGLVILLFLTAPPGGQRGEQAMVGMGGISADAETSVQAVFMINVFYGWELGTSDLLGRLDDSLQGFLIC